MVVRVRLRLLLVDGDKVTLPRRGIIGRRYGAAHDDGGKGHADDDFAFLDAPSSILWRSGIDGDRGVDGVWAVSLVTATGAAIRVAARADGVWECTVQ